jgi:hypothetical protein
MFCRCGKEIHPKRVEILQSRNQRLQCISCAEGTVQRVAGFMPSESKMRGQIIITDQDTVRDLIQKSERSGGIVSSGCRMKGH